VRVCVCVCWGRALCVCARVRARTQTSAPALLRNTRAAPHGRCSLTRVCAPRPHTSLTMPLPSATHALCRDGPPAAEVGEGRQAPAATPTPGGPNRVARPIFGEQAPQLMGGDEHCEPLVGTGAPYPVSRPRS